MNIETLRIRLRDENLTKLAAKTGLSVRTIRRIKNETCSANSDTVEKLAAALSRKARRT